MPEKREPTLIGARKGRSRPRSTFRTNEAGSRHRSAAGGPAGGRPAVPAFMGMLGRPLDWSIRAHFTGPWQYNSGLEVARVFHMRVYSAGRRCRSVPGRVRSGRLNWRQRGDVA